MKYLLLAWLLGPGLAVADEAVAPRGDELLVSEWRVGVSGTVHCVLECEDVSRYPSNVEIARIIPSDGGLAYHEWFLSVPLSSGRWQSSKGSPYFDVRLWQAGGSYGFRSRGEIELTGRLDVFANYQHTSCDIFRDGYCEEEVDLVARVVAGVIFRKRFETSIGAGGDGISLRVGVRF